MHEERDRVPPRVGAVEDQRPALQLMREVGERDDARGPVGQELM